jgi:hypothetical protein
MDTFVQRIDSSFGYGFIIDREHKQAWVEGNGLKSSPIPIKEQEDLKEVINKLSEEQHDLMDA